MSYLCLLLPLLNNLGCGSGIKASFMPLTLHEISASLPTIPCARPLVASTRRRTVARYASAGLKSKLLENSLRAIQS